MAPEDDRYRHGAALTAEAVALLHTLGQAPGPVGAREALRGLLAAGYEASEATVSRRLRDLDRRGLTSQAGRKGRVLTAQGNAELRARLRARERDELFGNAAEVRNGDDVLHLLKARRAVEPEAVLDGAQWLSKRDIADLQRGLAEHERAFERDVHIPRALVLDFHRQVTAFTKNGLVAAMVRIALDPTLDHVEAALDVILETRHTEQRSVTEHAEIIDALAKRDGERAARAMRHHLDRLVSETTTFVDRHDRELVTRLLEQRT